MKAKQLTTSKTKKTPTKGVFRAKRSSGTKLTRRKKSIASTEKFAISFFDTYGGMMSRLSHK